MLLAGMGFGKPSELIVHHGHSFGLIVCCVLFLWTFQETFCEINFLSIQHFRHVITLQGQAFVEGQENPGGQNGQGAHIRSL